MPEPVELVVNGRPYGGWQKVRVRRSMQQIANSFELEVTERWAGNDTPRPIVPSATAELYISGDRVISGFVDDVAPSYDDKSHGVTVAGRDKTGDLVDCTGANVQVPGKKLDELARRLSDPFGIPVLVATDVGGAFRSWKPDEFSTVYDVLEQAARMRGVLLISTGAGGLRITRRSDERAATELLLGENVLAASGRFSHIERFQEYIVLGQQAGDDTTWGEQSAESKGVAVDPRIGRHRPRKDMAEEPASSAECQERAEWQRIVAYGRSQQATYTVAGWRDGTDLWRPNIQVRIRDRFMGLDGWFQLVDVEFVLDENGARTNLTLMPPEAFDRKPVPEPGAETGSKWP